MGNKIENFGGDWTRIKLECLRQYLKAYTTALNKKFKLYYVDAFAGTGYVKAKQCEHCGLLFPELSEGEGKQFIDGSAKIALQTNPTFQKYFFIENDAENFQKLQLLKLEFPNLANNIIIENREANEYLQEFCRRDWKNCRAIIFLDPYGMQVNWETIEIIAKTQAIDLWWLFPLGVAVNRLLKRDGKIIEKCRETLNRMFGTTDWYNAFYRADNNNEKQGYFWEEDEESFVKIANFTTIKEYSIKRLETIFAGVSNKAKELYNSSKNPLYLLIFASSSPTGAPIALRIANHILEHI